MWPMGLLFSFRRTIHCELDVHFIFTTISIYQLTVKSKVIKQYVYVKLYKSLDELFIC